MMRRLEGRIALVTGAGRGIGTAVSHRLAREGATVWVTDILQEKVDTLAAEIRKEGGQARAARLDIVDRAQWREVVGQIRASNGALDVLVNNAGLVVAKDFEETELDEWRKLLTTNLEGPYLGIKECLSIMRESARHRPFGGSIINMSSVSGIVGSPILVGYTTAKGGLRLFSKCLALEFGRKNYRIRVNSVHPGMIDTESAQRLLEARVRQGINKTIQEAKEASQANFPLGRLGATDDVAGGVAFLASDDAGYVTGTELIIDGGLTAQ